MADLGTSVALQGNYESPKPYESKVGDNIIDILDSQEKARIKEQEDFDKQLAPYASVDTKNMLPERVPQYTEKSNDLLRTIMEKRRGGNKSAFYDPEVQQKLSDLKQTQSKFVNEYNTTKKYTELIKDSNNAGAYDAAWVKKVSDAWEGKAGLDENNYITEDEGIKAQTYSAYDKDLPKYVQSLVIDSGKEYQVQRIGKDGTAYFDKVKGAAALETPEGFADQVEYNKKKLLENNNFARRILKITQGVIDNSAKDDLLLYESMKGKTPQEIYDMQLDMAAKSMAEQQRNANKLATADIDKRPPSKGGLDFTNNFGGSTVTNAAGNFTPTVKQGRSEEELNKGWEAKREQYYKDWLNKKGKTDQPKYREEYERIINKKTQSDPNITIDQQRKNLYYSEKNRIFKGGELIEITYSPTPKYKGGFLATTNNGKNILVEPQSYLIDKNGDVKEVTAYQIDESTKAKKDNTLYQIDVTQGNNKNNFLTKYGGGGLESGTYDATGIKLNTKTVRSNENATKPSAKSTGIKPKKTEYKLTELTVDFINGLGEGEIITVDGIKRVKQGGKLKKVKQ